MSIKIFVKKLIGKKNVERYSFLKDSFNLFFYRGLRFFNNLYRRETMGRDFLEIFEVPEKQIFFGYYDITPFSKNNERILAMCAPKKNVPPTKSTEILVGYFNRSNRNTFNEIGKTTTWCWQQGCRLQWYPEDENRQVIYNVLVNGKLGSVIQDIKTKQILKRLRHPIYSVNATGNFAISLNFARLHRLRPGYGYAPSQDTTEGIQFPGKDGIWKVNLETDEAELIVSLEQLYNTRTCSSMQGADHYINHLAYNISGSRFMFFHLWLKEGKRFCRMLTSDPDGSNIYILEDEGMTSHYTWKSDNKILATVSYSDGSSKYNSYQDKTNSKIQIGRDLLTRDGHPSYWPNQSLILTDTCPDKFGDQRLLLFTKQGNLNELIKFYSSAKFRGEVRCDLHPRWDRSGQFICVDSPDSGKRELCIIDLKKISVPFE